MANLDYLGASRQRLDDRGRLHMPQRWQERIAAEQELVLTAGPMGCLWLLERTAWERAVAQLDESLLLHGNVLMMRSLLVGHAEPVTLDKQNRILVSEALRGYADLRDANAVYLVGSGLRIEIWSQTNWDRQVEAAKSNMMLFDQISHSGSKPVEAPVAPTQTS